MILTISMMLRTPIDFQLDLELHPDAVIHLFVRDSLVLSLDEPHALIDATIARLRVAG